MLQSLPTDVLLYVIQPFLDYDSYVHLNSALPARDKCVRRWGRAVLLQHHLHAWKQTCAGIMRRMTDLARPPLERMTHTTRLIYLFVYRQDTVRLMVQHVTGFRDTLLGILHRGGTGESGMDACLHLAALKLLACTHFTTRVHSRPVCT